jgi:hypothetical protein
MSWSVCLSRFFSSHDVFEGEQDPDRLHSTRDAQDPTSSEEELLETAWILSSSML